jgi:hypothetical protein
MGETPYWRQALASWTRQLVIHGERSDFADHGYVTQKP